MNNEPIMQDEALPESFNRDERNRKIEQERQLLSVEKKLDALTMLLKGDGSDVPGLVGRIVKLEHQAWGTEDRMGDATRTALMWKSWIWLLCTGSAIVGGGLTQLARYIFKI